MRRRYALTWWGKSTYWAIGHEYFRTRGAARRAAAKHPDRDIFDYTITDTKTGKTEHL